MYCRHVVYRSLLCAALILAARPSGTDADVGTTPLTMRGDADPRIEHGIDLIYRLRFSEADAYFQNMIAADPDNPAGHFFLAMVGWWRVLIDLDDRSHDEALYELLQRCIDVCDRRLDQNPDDFDAIMFKGGAVGFRGRLRGDRHEYMRAARDGLRSLPLLKKSRQLEPTNKDILFGQGIYNYFADVIPEKHPIVRPVMLFLQDGNRELGLQQLREVAREGRYARAEALYFLAQIHRLFEEDHKAALPYLEQLHALYPENALFHRYRARTLIALGRWADGIAQYQEVVRRSQAGAAGYHTRGHIEAVYYIGKNSFRLRRHADAVGWLSSVDSLVQTLPKDKEPSATNGYVALSLLYLGMTRDELGERDAAVDCFNRVLQLPAQGRSHDLARRYKKQPYGEAAGSATP